MSSTLSMLMGRQYRRQHHQREQQQQINLPQGQEDARESGEFNGREGIRGKSPGACIRTIRRLFEPLAYNARFQRWPKIKTGSVRWPLQLSEMLGGA